MHNFIKKLEPFGASNPMPIFLIKRVKLVDYRRVGRKGEHLKVTFKKEKTYLSGIHFGCNLEDSCIENTSEAVFCIHENKWNGNVNYELKCISIR